MEHRPIDDLQQQTTYAAQSKKRQRPVFRLFNTLAAALVCALLVGSLLFVFGALKQQQQTKTGSQVHGHAPASSQPVTLLPTPNPRGNAAGLYVVDDGTLYRVDATTGKRLWHYSLPGDSNAKNGPGFLAYVFATGDGIVYVGENDGGNPYPANKLYAFDAVTGYKLWTLPLDLQALQFADGTLYGSVNGEGVVAINPATGATIWKNAQAGGTLSSQIVAVDNGVVYAFNPSDGSTTFQLFALRASDGTQIWAKTGTGLQTAGSPTLANGVLYVGGSSARPGTDLQSAPNYVQAYSASDGHKLWPSQPLTGMVVAAPAVANGLVYIGTNRGYLYALNTNDGRIHLQIQPGGDVSGPAYVVNNTLYVAPLTNATNTSVTSQVKAYDATTGGFEWSRTVAGLSASDSAGAAGGMGGGRFIATANAIYCLVFNQNGSGSTVQLLSAATGNPLPGSSTQIQATYGTPFMVLTR